MKKSLLKVHSMSDVDSELIEAARVAALSLLARSVQFKHQRLAVQRLIAATRVGASIPSELRMYCLAQIGSLKDPNLIKSFLAASKTGSAHTDVP